jgi:hypothetical protein
VPISRRNHFLDVESMNEAAGHMLAAQKIPLGTRRHTRARDDDDDTPTPNGPAPASIFDPRKIMAGFASRVNRS